MDGASVLWREQLHVGPTPTYDTVSGAWNDWKAMTMTIPNNSSAKRITVQIPTASGDAIEAWSIGPRAAAPTPLW